MTFRNLSFEDVGVQAGIAESWVFSAHSQVIYAPFEGPESVETFDWTPGYKTVFNGIGNDLVPAGFGGGNEPVERFEKEWLQNETYVYGITGVAASFDVTTPEFFEDFEEEWSSNETFLYAFTDADLTAASFDGTPEAFEDFEEDWVSGYKTAYVGVGSDLTAASFDVTPEAFEDFEEDWTGFEMVTI